MALTHSHVWHDSFTAKRSTHAWHAWHQDKPSLVHMCDMNCVTREALTYSSVRQGTHWFMSRRNSKKMSECSEKMGENSCMSKLKKEMWKRIDWVGKKNSKMSECPSYVWQGTYSFICRTCRPKFFSDASKYILWCFFFPQIYSLMFFFPNIFSDAFFFSYVWQADQKSFLMLLYISSVSFERKQNFVYVWMRHVTITNESFPCSWHVAFT